jgi:transglutaminase-like putative cysteine protease
MRYQVSHRTTYRYDEAVDLADHLLHLSPRDCAAQKVLSAEITCSPPPHRQHRRLDHFGNIVTQVAIEDPHTTITITALCTVDVAFPPPPPLGQTPPWEEVRDQLAGDGFPTEPMVAEFTHPSPIVPDLKAARSLAEQSFTPGRPFADALYDLTSRIHRDFRFSPGATAVSTPVAEVLESRRGVCQDFAHVQIACLRALGLAGRYVSGYLRTHPPLGKPRLVGADASHAWVSAWCPGFGWIDVDPTNDLVVAQEHVVLAWGRDFADVSPVRGVILGGGSHSLDVAVQMDELP